MYKKIASLGLVLQWDTTLTLKKTAATFPLDALPSRTEICTWLFVSRADTTVSWVLVPLHMNFPLLSCVLLQHYSFCSKATFWNYAGNSLNMLFQRMRSSFLMLPLWGPLKWLLTIKLNQYHLLLYHIELVDSSLNCVTFICVQQESIRPLLMCLI